MSKKKTSSGGGQQPPKPADVPVFEIVRFAKIENDNSVCIEAQMTLRGHPLDGEAVTIRVNGDELEGCPALTSKSGIIGALAVIDGETSSLEVHVSSVKEPSICLHRVFHVDDRVPPTATRSIDDEPDVREAAIHARIAKYNKKAKEAEAAARPKTPSEEEMLRSRPYRIEFDEQGGWWVEDEALGVCVYRLTFTLQIFAQNNLAAPEWVYLLGPQHKPFEFTVEGQLSGVDSTLAVRYEGRPVKITITNSSPGYLRIDAFTQGIDLETKNRPRLPAPIPIPPRTSRQIRVVSAAIFGFMMLITGMVTTHNIGVGLEWLTTGSQSLYERIAILQDTPEVRYSKSLRIQTREEYYGIEDEPVDEPTDIETVQNQPNPWLPTYWLSGVWIPFAYLFAPWMLSLWPMWLAYGLQMIYMTRRGIGHIYATGNADGKRGERFERLLNTFKPEAPTDGSQKPQEKSFLRKTVEGFVEFGVKDGIFEILYNLPGLIKGSFSRILGKPQPQ